jgi:hypothetical protein
MRGIGSFGAIMLTLGLLLLVLIAGAVGYDVGLATNGEIGPVPSTS